MCHLQGPKQIVTLGSSTLLGKPACFQQSAPFVTILHRFRGLVVHTLRSPRVTLVSICQRHAALSERLVYARLCIHVPCPIYHFFLFLLPGPQRHRSDHAAACHRVSNQGKDRAQPRWPALSRWGPSALHPCAGLALPARVYTAPGVPAAEKRKNFRMQQAGGRPFCQVGESCNYSAEIIGRAL